MRYKYKKLSVMVALVLSVGAYTVAGAAGYEYGTKGGEIPAIQKKLIAAGYKARLNGEYDANTKWAVRLYQKDMGLPVNGIVDNATYKSLMGKALDESKLSKLGKMSEKKIAAEWAASQPSKGDKSKDKKADSKSKKSNSKTKKNKEDKDNKSDKRNTIKMDSARADSLLDPFDSDFVFTKTGKVSKSVQDVIQEAENYRGVPYVFGGNTPSGFDCSGYVRYVFAKKGITLPRSADEQYTVGTKVAKKNLQPGDLVFFETYEKGVSHSGIYIGNGKFISATSSSGVAVADLAGGYWGERYIGAKRVM
ncbi:NlpC/P60 family protein [uncultured Veillonella sp.]|uniref:C40 family peptidase n=1 Tax=uncultured Veillonella sp. TaxID=159268 RepID=UPI00260D6CAD|nr:NlpC/P60 family protein [uncultured Veillonella sp.]